VWDLTLGRLVGAVFERRRPSRRSLASLRCPRYRRSLVMRSFVGEQADAVPGCAALRYVRRGGGVDAREQLASSARRSRGFSPASQRRRGTPRSARPAWRSPVRPMRTVVHQAPTRERGSSCEHRVDVGRAASPRLARRAAEPPALGPDAGRVALDQRGVAALGRLCSRAAHEAETVASSTGRRARRLVAQ
jgi:hypothetical protein